MESGSRLKSKCSLQLEEGTQKCSLRKLAAFSFRIQQPQKKALCERKSWHLFCDMRATSIVMIPSSNVC